MDEESVRYKVGQSDGWREQNIHLADGIDRLLKRECICSPERHVTSVPRVRMSPTQVVALDRERMLGAIERNVESVDVRDVFEHWKAKMQKHGQVRLTDERRKKIQARLKDGYSVADIKLAVDGCAQSDFHMARGQYRGGRRYDDLTLILRNGSRLEGFRDNANGDTTTDLRKFL